MVHVSNQLLKKTAQSLKNDLENSYIEPEEIRCDSEELLNLCLVLLGCEANTIEFFLDCIEIRSEDDVQSNHDNQ